MSRDLRTQYEGITPKFVDAARMHNAPSRAAYLSHLSQDLSDKLVLDVGCGAGDDLQECLSRGAACSGLDAAHEMVLLAQKNAPKAIVTQGFMEDIPYSDNTFDLVLSRYALQTSTDVPHVLREMTRVLKPGGEILYLAVDPLRQFIEKRKNPKDYFLQEIVESVFFEGTMRVHEPTHTLNEYLNSEFLATCDLLTYDARADFPSVKQINGNTYPCYFIIKARKRTV